MRYARAARALPFLLLAIALQCTGSSKEAPPGAGAPGAAPQRPDIVIILADDLGYSDIAPYGGEIDTPNLSRLAAEGLRFRFAYNTARCCPTRASLLTGLYPHMAGVGHMIADLGHPGYRGDLRKDAPTIAERLKDAGYACYMSGKWHVTKNTGHWTGRKEFDKKENWPLQRGFDHFYGTIHGAGSYYDPVTLTRDNTPLPRRKPGYYYTDAIGREAARFVRKHAEQHAEQPFFLYVAFTAPHWPLHAPEETIAKYKGRFDKGWEKLREARLARMKALGIVPQHTRLSPAAASWRKAPFPEWQKRAMEVYAAMVDRMDQSIGVLLESLRESKREDNCIVFFLADNGGCAEGGRAFKRAAGKRGLSRWFKDAPDGKTVVFGKQATRMPGPPDTYQEYGKPWANLSNTPFRYFKHYVHEGGIATPFIVRWPKGLAPRLRGKFSDQLAHVIDLQASAVDLAGLPRNKTGTPPLAGMSLAATLRGAPPRDRTLYFEHEGNRAIRTNNWKLVSRHRRGKQHWELYDMRSDRSELSDLSKSQTKLATELATRYAAWAKRSQVRPWPIRKPSPRKRTPEKH